MSPFEAGMVLHQIAMKCDDATFLKIKDDLKKLETELLRLYDIEESYVSKSKDTPVQA